MRRAGLAGANEDPDTGRSTGSVSLGPVRVLPELVVVDDFRTASVSNARIPGSNARARPRRAG